MPPLRRINEVCRDWLRHKCMRGDLCMYIHETPPPPPGQALAVQALSRSQGGPPPMICRDWQRGRCKRPRCRFLHETPNRKKRGGGW
mmetsp:Transcript_27691/g.48912  ORF Transcript_27691/g.48912 Transcript_27691/m.48912 type:complete len:87 (+) Transcript_27691:60-320(+)